METSSLSEVSSHLKIPHGKDKCVKHSFIKTLVEKNNLLIETSGPRFRDNTWHLGPEWRRPGERKVTDRKHETRPEVDALTSQFSKLTLFKTCAPAIKSILIGGYTEAFP